MDRKEFLKALGMSTGAAVLGCCLGGCSKSDNPSMPGTGTGGGQGGSKVDFTFDVNSDANLVANGWTIRSGTIIAKSGATYLAYQSTCPHQGFALSYMASNNSFPCTGTGPSHGSVFDSNGKRMMGPAQADLKKYSTTLTGNNLRVFEA